MKHKSFLVSVFAIVLLATVMVIFLLGVRALKCVSFKNTYIGPVNVCSHIHKGTENGR